MEVPKKLKDEIWEYCHANDITNVEGFTETMLKQGFNVEKYGTSPFDTTQEVEPPEPEVIEKEVIKEIIKEVPVEKIVEKRIEVPVDKIVYVDKVVEKEVPVEKIVYKTDDEVVNKLQTELNDTKTILKDSISDFDEERKAFDLVIKEREEEIAEEIDELRRQLDEKPDVIEDERYKGFWEEEIESHDKTKEEIRKLKDIIDHLKGGSNDNNDIYGDQEKSKGWWGGGSNLKRKK